MIFRFWISVNLTSQSTASKILSSIQGKLRANFSFWRDVVRASEFVLDIIQNGYQILFRKSPLPFSIENRSYVLHQRSFVQGAISEFLTRGCVRQTPIYPQFWKPQHVAVQSSGKLRLVLNLSHLNKFIIIFLSSTKIWEQFFKCFFHGCLVFRLILSQLSVQRCLWRAQEIFIV